MFTSFVYAGRTMDGTKCLYQYHEIDENDVVFERPLYFAKPLKRGVAIGTTFDVEVERHDERLSVKSTGPASDQIADRAQIAQWSAADKATATILANISNDRKRAREANDPIDDAIAVLRDAMSKQRTIAARAAFSSYVNSAIHGAR